MLTERQIEFLESHAKNYIPDKQAFSCMKGKGCSKHKCPAYWDFKWNLYNKELQAHSEKPIEGCSFILQPIFLADVVTTVYTGIDSNRQVAEAFTKIAENLDGHTKEVKQGMVALMRLMSVKDIQRVLVENEELRNQLNERNITLIEGETDAKHG